MGRDVTPREIAQRLLKSSSVTVFAHYNPDADAYGASCGLALALRACGIQATVYNESGFLPRYNAIPGASEVIAELPESAVIEPLVVVVDCGALERVGDTFLSTVQRAAHLINIDHHTSNTLFGAENMVVESASSTSELIHDVLVALDEVSGKGSCISQDVAVALFAGIMGDTGSFRYASTSAKTFLVAHDLVQRGARPDRIAEALFSSVSVEALRLRSEALTGVELLFNNSFAEVTVTTEMLNRHGAEVADADSLAEKGRDIQGVCVSALYKQDGDIWRVSLRSRGGAVDVSQIAQSFGGGGHKPAAAFRWRNDIATLKGELREKVRAALGARNA